MMKKLLLSLALIATTSLAFANPAPYLGGSLGITANTNNKGSGSYRGMPFTGFVGFGGAIDPNYYLAGELSLTVGTADIDNAGNMKSSYGYGISVLPGVMLSDHTSGFLRVGIVRSRFPDANTNLTGGQFGLGLQTSVTQNVDLRTEYDYIAYRSSSSTASTPGISTSPTSDQFNLALIYKFD